ncbi:MAG: hypothetical protein K6G38_02525 [Gammaproteobacteria bacterium]|nr:hypothetical protein [Gammaproteobacteria bacterium]
MNKNELRELRENIVKFLYILEVGGEYERDEVEDLVYDTVSDIINHTDEIENIISSSLEHYTLNRLNLVDKCIMKLSVYEMMYKDLAPEIAIDEALEITKVYSDIDGKQVRFNNKVLDKAKELIIEWKKR